MGTLNVKGLGTFTVPDSFGQLSPEEQQRSVSEMVAHVQGGSAGAQTSAPPTPTSNVFTGVKQEAEAAVGGLADALASGRSAVQSRILGNPADDPATSYVRGVGKSYNDAAAATGYDPGTYEKAYDQGGVPGVVSHFGKEFVTNTPHMLATANPVTLGADFASTTQRNAEERARNDGRTDGPGLSDYLVGGGTAGLQELAGVVGARALVKPALKTVEGAVVPGVRAALARIGKATATDATAGAAGGEAQYLGTHAGTQAGATPEGAVDSAIEGGGAGLVGGAGTRTGVEAVNRIQTDRTAVNALKGEAMIAKLGTNGEEQAASNMRVAQAADALRKQAKDEGTLGTAPQDSNTYKTVQNDLVGNLKSTIKRLEDVGDITHEQKSALIGADGGLLDLAEKSNHLFVPGKVNEIVDRLGIEDGVKQGLKDGFRDLNTATYNSMAKNSTGPLEKVANYVATPAGTAAAAGLGLTYGLPYAAAGLAVSHGIKLAGRVGDRLLGNGTVPAEASLTALRAAALKRQSLADAAQRDTLGTLRSASDAVTQRLLARSDAAKATAAAKVTAKQQAEIDRLRLMSAVSPDAPISGGHLAEVANWFRNQGHDASIEHVQEAVDRLNARGGFSSPEQYRAAREGQVFPGKTLVPLFRETGAVLADHGIGRDTDVKAGEKADAAITRAKVRALVSEAVPKAPRSPVEAPSVADTTPRPPQAPPVPRGPRKAPGGAANAPPSTIGFEEGRRLHAYAATTFRAKMAEEQAVRSAGGRIDLQELAGHIADLESKDAKAQAYAEALKKYHGDAEALRFVMGPLRTLAGIGGKSEPTAEHKAVIRVRSKKTSK